MASTKEYLDFVLEQLSGIENITYRAMMGEYVLYCRGSVVGGVYDNRFLIKGTSSVLRLMDAQDLSPEWDIPYPGAKEMLVVDVDNFELCRYLVEAAAEDLRSAGKKK